MLWNSYVPELIICGRGVYTISNVNSCRIGMWMSSEALRGLIRPGHVEYDRFIDTQGLWESGYGDDW